MTLTRSQRGITPRKTEHPGMVETPSRRKSTRISSSPLAKHDESDGTPDDSFVVAKPKKSSARANGKANGHSHGPSDEQILDGWRKGLDPKIDYSGHFEFGGSPGVLAIMLFFPGLMYYMWIGATYYDGKPPTPAKGESFQDFLRHMGNLVYTGAFPTMKAWTIYWVFFVFEMACYVVLPGVYAKGKPLNHEGGKQLTYYCSGVWSQWTTITIAAVLHVTGIFKLYTLIDEFGPIMSVAILSGFGVSLVAYVSALYRGAQHRMTGKPLYDFFMGAELNPRMFGILDFKMFFEVRLPWYILLLTTASVAARQYEQYGWVPKETAFLLMAHFLYANACSKGEQLIVPTWDMYYEKWGWMLIFWNMAGVPLSYCHCTLYLANHAPSEFSINRYAMATMFVVYLFAYWVWDTTNSQKNTFRHQERGGGYEPRKAFPQLPWQSVKNPKTIKTSTGDSILADGWYAWARKPHYTCDLIFAISWGLVTGFNSPFPWFYPFFFSCMIAHRALRDIQRCRRKYGDAWTEYEKQVPYLFIPYVL